MILTMLSSQAQEKSRAISTNVKYFYQDQPGCAAASANVKLEELKIDVLALGDGSPGAFLYRLLKLLQKEVIIFLEQILFQLFFIHVPDFFNKICRLYLTFGSREAQAEKEFNIFFCQIEMQL